MTDADQMILFEGWTTPAVVESIHISGHLPETCVLDFFLCSWNTVLSDLLLILILTAKQFNVSQMF